jgi:S1-C subfamily serine protease
MNRIAATAAAGILSAGLLFGACSDRELSPSTATEGVETAAATSSAPGTAPSVQTTVSKTNELSTADLVKLAEPSIVRIDTSSGVGSGFIVSEEGHIVTNRHVVVGRSGRPQATVGVTLSDGSRVDGQVLGTDTRYDIAVIKISGPEKFKALSFAKLSDVLVGQDVVAIGYALDLKGGEGAAFTVTRGIVSAKNRSTSETSSSFGAIQTDASINHGNSGGPLLNLNGEVVGVNTSLATDTTTGGIAQGIGFALGSDIVKAVADDIRNDGEVTRGYLGLAGFEPLRPARAKGLKLPTDLSGVHLTPVDGRGVPAVVPGGPASEAGLRDGDVITKIAGDLIKTESDLAAAMLKAAPGKKVEVEFYRDGKKQSVTVELGTPPPSP